MQHQEPPPHHPGGPYAPRRSQLVSVLSNEAHPIRWSVALALLALSTSCHRGTPNAAAEAASSAEAAITTSSTALVAPSSGTGNRPLASAEPTASAAAAPVIAPAAAAPDPKRYRWLAAGNLKFPQAVDSLVARFPTPPGYKRVAETAGSFGEWLRGLPLAAPDTPVLNNSGDTVFKTDDDYVAAVVAIDVGVGDLQQSSDAVIRLNAEWLWASDKLDAISYRSASKLDMPWSRWQHGQRLMASGPNVFWVVKTKPRDPSYDDFRQYIDSVMLWTNSIALATRASRVDDPKALEPGDFFLQSKGKGHVILVLDVAEKPTGERVALLGRALQNPAQSIHVIRPGKATSWFSLRPPNGIMTPHSGEFVWSELERLGPPEENK